MYDLLVRDNVHVNNQLSVKKSGVFAIGNDMIPNKTQLVQFGIGDGETIVHYPRSGNGTNPSEGCGLEEEPITEEPVIEEPVEYEH